MLYSLYRKFSARIQVIIAKAFFDLNSFPSPHCYGKVNSSLVGVSKLDLSLKKGYTNRGYEKDPLEISHPFGCSFGDR